MKLQDKIIKLDNGAEFVLSPTHYNGAICTLLVTNEDWDKVAEEVTKELNDYYGNTTEDNFNDEVDKALLDHSKGFYYADMEEEDWIHFFDEGKPQPNYEELLQYYETHKDKLFEWRV